MARITTGRRMSLLVLAATALMVLGVQAAFSPVNVAPDNIGQPTVSGTAMVGDELTAGNGTWSNSPTSFSYQWQRCTSDGASCTAIDGATGRTYGVRNADLTRTMRVVVTARERRRLVLVDLRSHRDREVRVGPADDDPADSDPEPAPA